MRNFLFVLSAGSFLLHSCQKPSEPIEPQDPITILSIKPDHGPAGTIVTIKGHGFKDSLALNKVFFNGKEASLISGYDETLIAAVPNQAGTGNVTVKVENRVSLGPIFTYEPSVIVSTFAGSADPGSSDGVGVNAHFSHPDGIVKDAAGNLYISDNYNKSIRKITPEGMVTTFARFDNLMNSPRGLDIDANGNLYVADNVLNAIYKVTPSGEVSIFTIAYGISSPLDLAISRDGKLYVVDYDNKRIAIVSPDAPAITFAGNGVLTSFIHPQGIKFDKAGNLYVVEDNKIQKITPSGVVTTVAGCETCSFNDGPALSTSFSNLRNITFDEEGVMYIAQRSKIRKLTSDGMIKTIAGNGWLGFADGFGLNTQFNSAVALVFDNKGNLFATDNENNRIRKIVFE